MTAEDHYKAAMEEHVAQLAVALNEALLLILCNKRNLHPSTRPGQDYVVDRAVYPRWMNASLTAAGAFVDASVKAWAAAKEQAGGPDDEPETGKDDS